MANSSHYTFIIDHNADVYTLDGKCLLRFRKKVLPIKESQTAFDNLIAFAKSPSKLRGMASGTSKGDRGNPYKTTPVMSNIIGYFDKWSVRQKYILKQKGLKPPSKVRVCAFNIKHPEKYEKVLPLIKLINQQYKKLMPSNHAKQLAQARKTAFHIPQTAFTTVTINYNYQTSYHTDSGDFQKGFGNLVVIEDGKYTGGYTLFPQYKIGVDVRTGDFLAMDVHQIHGNMPLKGNGNRMSLVSYLREKVVEKSSGSTQKDVDKTIKLTRKLMNYV